MFVKIGPLQERILQHLSLNPNQNKQQIQRGLRIPDKNYPSVRNSLMSLEKEGYVQTKDARSQKNLPIKLYRLTEKGIVYVFATNNVDFVKVMESYEDDIHFLPHYTKQAKVIQNPNIMKKLIQNAAQVVLMQGDKEAIDMNPETMWSLSTSAMLLYGRLTPSEREHLKNFIFKNRKSRRLFRNVQGIVKILTEENEKEGVES